LNPKMIFIFSQYKNDSDTLSSKYTLVPCPYNNGLVLKTSLFERRGGTRTQLAKTNLVAAIGRFTKK